MQRDISEQRPLQAASSFHLYLERHRLNWIEIARASGVPCLTVWSIARGLAVDRTRAVMVRKGLKKLTGERFDGFIATAESGGIHHER